VSYKVKFGFPTGYNLVFSAFQPGGAGRGLEQQPLPEIQAKGYYVATPITSLVVGDMVLAYEIEDVYWEDDLVYILSDVSIYYEGDRVHWEGEWIFYSDEEASENVVCLGDVVGSGEYKSVIETSENLTEIETKVDVTDENIDLLIVEAQRVNDVWDARKKREEVVIIGNL